MPPRLPAFIPQGERGHCVLGKKVCLVYQWEDVWHFVLLLEELLNSCKNESAAGAALPGFTAITWSSLKKEGQGLQPYLEPSFTPEAASVPFYTLPYSQVRDCGGSVS